MNTDPDRPTPPGPPDEPGIFTLTVPVSGATADLVQRIAEHQGRPPDQVAREALTDELRRRPYQELARDPDRWTAHLDGLALRLAEIMRDLQDLPRHEAARLIALTHVHVGTPVPEDLFADYVRQMTGLWNERFLIEFGGCRDGTFGPLEDLPLQITITPTQWDTLHRLGTGSIKSAAQSALTAGLRTLDTGEQGSGPA